MSEVSGVLVGKVVSYVENCGSTSSKVKALIQAGASIVSVDLEFFQYEFIMQEYPIGSAVNVVYYGDSWHFQGLREKRDNGMAITRAIKTVGRQAFYLRKEMAGPSGTASEPADMEGDIDYVMSHIGTFDLNKPADHSFKGMRWPSRKSANCN